MAKGARASSKKANKTRLRAKVFGPVEQARVARLSARLVQLANKKDDEMVDVAKVLEAEGQETADDSKDQASMDVDSVNLVQKPTLSSTQSKSLTKKRIDKKRTKPRNQMVFKSMLRKKKGSK